MKCTIWARAVQTVLKIPVGQRLVYIKYVLIFFLLNIHHSSYFKFIWNNTRTEWYAEDIGKGRLNSYFRFLTRSAEMQSYPRLFFLCFICKKKDQLVHPLLYIVEKNIVLSIASERYVHRIKSFSGILRAWFVPMLMKKSLKYSGICFGSLIICPFELNNRDFAFFVFERT